MENEEREKINMISINEYICIFSLFMFLKYKVEFKQNTKKEKSAFFGLNNSKK